MQLPKRSTNVIVIRLITILLLLSCLVTSLIRVSILKNIHDDEGYYLSTIYRLSLGDKTFVNSPLETFCYILAPFSTLFLWLKGSSSGYVLFFHLVYWAFVWLVAFVIYSSVGNFISRPISVSVSMFYPLYLHYYPILFYTNLGMGFFTIFLFLSFIRISRGLEPSIGLLAGQGALLALAGLAQPAGFFLPAIYIALYFLLALKKTGNRTAVFYLLAFSSLTVLLFFSFNNISFLDFLHQGMRYHKYTEVAGAPAGGSKLISLINALFSTSPFWGLGLIATFVTFIFLGRKEKAREIFFTFVFVPFLFFLINRGYGSEPRGWFFPAFAGGSLGMVKFFSLLGLIFFSHLKQKQKWHWDLFFVVWVPSFLAAINLAFTSNTGPGNLGIGLLPAFIASLIFFDQAIFDSKEIQIERLVPKMFFLAIFIYHLSSYLDLNQFQFSQRGPFQGLLTSESVRQTSDQLTQAIEPLKNKKTGRILFRYNPFRGYAYLFSQQPPGESKTVQCIASPEFCNQFKSGLDSSEINTLVLNTEFEKVPDFLPFFHFRNVGGPFAVFERDNPSAAPRQAQP